MMYSVLLTMQDVGILIVVLEIICILWRKSTRLQLIKAEALFLPQPS